MKKFLLITASVLLMFAFSIPAFAMDDDPGKERLGKGNVPAVFFDPPYATISSSGVSALHTYGTKKSPFTNLVYTLHQAGDIVNGIDISQYQSNVDWKQVKASGVKFVLLRCACRGYGTGALVKDTKFKDHIQGALKAGLDVGVYIFSQATNKAEAVEEANKLLECVDEYKDKVTLPLILDFEYASDYKGDNTGRLYKANLSKSQATEVCRAFCERIENAGYVPMVYANATMLKNKVDGEALAADYPIWLAHYTVDPTIYEGPYQYWQYSSKGRVPGIKGDVDCDFHFGIFMPFTDVTWTEWFYQDVGYVYQNEIMKGTSVSHFRPKNKTERCMMAAVLYRISKEKAPAYKNTFTDVPAGQWYTDAIAWAYGNHIVEGYGNDKFGPNDPITREQFANMLYRYAKYCGYDTSASAPLTKFTDSDKVSKEADTAMRWAVAKGYLQGKIQGKSDMIMDPRGNATRAQCAAILARFMRENN